MSSFGFSRHQRARGAGRRGGAGGGPGGGRSAHAGTARAGAVGQDGGGAAGAGRARYAAWWAEHPKAALGDVSFTLATGRSHLEQRAALVAGSAAEAGALLAALAAGRPAPGLYTGRAAAWPPGATPPALLASLRRGTDDERQLAETLAQLYVHGVTADFAALHARRPGRKLALPPYPFQRQRYWTPPPRRRKLAV